MLCEIEQAITSAMKSQDSERLKTLRLIKTDLIKEQTKGSHDRAMSIEEENNVLRRMVKQREETISEYNKAGRQDLADVEAREVAIIKEFLPKEPSTEELKACIETEIAAYKEEMLAKDSTFKLSMRGMKPIVTAVSAKYSSGQIGKLTSEVLKTLI